MLVEEVDKEGSADCGRYDTDRKFRASKDCSRQQIAEQQENPSHHRGGEKEISVIRPYEQTNPMGNNQTNKSDDAAYGDG